MKRERKIVVIRLLHGVVFVWYGSCDTSLRLHHEANTNPHTHVRTNFSFVYSMTVGVSVCLSVCVSVHTGPVVRLCTPVIGPN